MPDARYRDLMPGWAPEYLPPEVLFWRLCRSGLCLALVAGDGSRSVSIAGCLPRWGGIGIFVWIFVAGVGLLPGFRVVIRRFLPDRPPEFSGIAVCRRCGRDFVK